MGTTKLYEIDLKTFSAEEFLDLTNPGVKATVASAAFQGSLPRCRVVLLDVVVVVSHWVLLILVCHQGCDAKAMRRRRPRVFARIHKTRPLRGLLWSTDKVRSVKALDRFPEHSFPQGAPSSGKIPSWTEAVGGLFGNILLRHGLSTWWWAFDLILSLDRIPAAWRRWRRYISSCGGLTASSCYWWRGTAIQVKFCRWSWTS